MSMVSGVNVHLELYHQSRVLLTYFKINQGYIRASREWDYDYGAMLCFFLFLYISYILSQSPASSVVHDNAPTLLCCEDPEMFRGRRNFT